MFPFKRSLREPSCDSEPRRATLHRRKSDAHIPSLNPELFLLILAVIHCQKNAGAARPAARNPRLAEAGVPAFRTPILHELIERVVAAGLLVRTAEEGVSP